MLTNLLIKDAGPANSESTSSTRFSWQQVRHAFIDRRVYLYVVIGVGNWAVFKCVVMYFPEFLKRMCICKEVHLFAIPIYFVTCICCLITGYSASCRNEHSFCLVFAQLIALLGFILKVTLSNEGNIAMYVSASIAYCGTFSAIPLFLSWLAHNVGGHTKRAGAIGLTNTICQIGGVLGPQVGLLLLKTCRIVYKNNL